MLLIGSFRVNFAVLLLSVWHERKMPLFLRRRIDVVVSEVIGAWLNKYARSDSKHTVSSAALVLIRQTLDATAGCLMLDVFRPWL